MYTNGAFPPCRNIKGHLWHEIDHLLKEKLKNRRSHRACEDVYLCLLRIADDQEVLRIMAGRKKEPGNLAGWEGFAKVELSDSDKEAFGEWELIDEDVFVLMADLLNTGYKLTLSYSDQNNSYNAALTCKDIASPNKGYTLSGYATSWYQALRVVLYKHVVVTGGNWSNAKQRPMGEIG